MYRQARIAEKRDSYFGMNESNPTTAPRIPGCRFIVPLPELPMCAAARAIVEPDVFHPPAVIDAVGHQGQVLDPGLPAGGARRVEQHWAHSRLGEYALDAPYDLLALDRVGFHRLLVHQLVELVVAVSGIVPQRAAHVILVEHLVGVVDTAFYRDRADSVVFARHLRIPESRID